MRYHYSYSSAVFVNRIWYTVNIYNDYFSFPYQIALDKNTNKILAKVYFNSNILNSIRKLNWMNKIKNV